MIKLVNKKDIEKIDVPKVIHNKIKEYLQIFDEEYGEKRHPDDSLGGFIMYIDNLEDKKIFEQEYFNLYDTIFEWQEIHNYDKEKYIITLYILSSDYQIITVEIYKENFICKFCR